MSNSRNKVYLAGPISGESYGTVTDWRVDVKNELAKYDILGFSPMRNKEYLRNDGSIGDHYEDHPLCTSKGITARDRFDTSTCDVLLVNFVGAKRVSIGTVWEIGHSDAARLPIVIAMEDGNAHDHAMIRESAGFIVPTLDEAVSVVKAILLP